MSHRINRYGVAPLLLILFLPAEDCPATGFSTDLGTHGALRSRFDLEVAYGLRVRTESRDKQLIAVASGGDNEANSNLDDGNLNYDRGKPVSNMVRAVGEATLQWRNFGLYARALAFYDYENDQRDRARTELGTEARDQVARDIRLQDAYISARFDWRVPLQFRLGDQVVSWGESTFFPATGINIVNPLDVAIAQQPTSTRRDRRRPVGMLWGAATITELFAVEGYYQYEWDETTLPALGTYLAGNDAIVPDANFAQFTGTLSDQGTDRCALFKLPAEAFPDNSCFDFGFFKSPRTADERADDQGQWGIKVQAILPALNDTTVALHYANYHSKTPMVGGFAVSEATAQTLSAEALAGLAGEFFPFYRDQGLAPPEAAAAAASAAFTSTFGQASQDVDWFLSYPEDIKMLGMSFNTTSIKTGQAFLGEISHHRDVPLLIHPGEFMSAVLPVPQPPDAPNADNPPAFAPDQRVESWMRRDVTQAVLGITQLLGPRLGASQTAVGGEVGWYHVHDFPDKSRTRLMAPGVAVLQYSPERLFADRDSWGYRLAGSMTYNNVFGAFTLTPRLIWLHDVDGNSPLGVPFVDGRRSLTLGLGANYLNTITTDLSYTAFWGAGASNTLNDRDFVNFTIRYFF